MEQCEKEAIKLIDFDVWHTRSAHFEETEKGGKRRSLYNWVKFSSEFQIGESVFRKKKFGTKTIVYDFKWFLIEIFY